MLKTFKYKNIYILMCCLIVLHISLLTRVMLSTPTRTSNMEAINFVSQFFGKEEFNGIYFEMFCQNTFIRHVSRFTRYFCIQRKTLHRAPKSHTKLKSFRTCLLDW
jgi:hypothetical protein